MSAPQSPSDQLSSQIADALIKAGLLRDEKRELLVAKIAAGTMSGDDWKNEIDFAVEKAAKA